MENLVTLYHTEISIVPVCKNGSERHGAKAYTTISFDSKKKFFEVEIWGKSIEEAKKRLHNFLSSDGKVAPMLFENKESEVGNG